MAPFSPPLGRATAPNLYRRLNSTRLKLIRTNYQTKSQRQNQVKDQQKGRRTRTVKANSRKDKSGGDGAEAKPNVNDVQASSVPDPIPADSTPLDTTIRTTLIISPTFSIGQAANTAAAEQATTYSSHVRSTTTVWVPATESIPLSSGFSSSSASAHPSTTNASNRLPVYSIAMVSVGAVVLVLAAVLVLKCCLRGHGPVDRPRPSAPILQESPLFGGKERFSRGIWSDPSFNNLLASHAKAGKDNGWRPLSGGSGSTSEKVQTKRQSIYMATNFAANDTAPSHLSPASVYTTPAPPPAVGVALDFPMPPLTVKPAIQPLKVKDKGTEGKTTRRRSVTTSMYGGLDYGSPTITETETAIAYTAPRPAPTPGKPKADMKPSGSSHGHAQKPARKNAAKRASQGSLYRSTSASRTGRGHEKEEPFMYTIPTVKSQDRRDRDTKALTSALGLSSPPAPSSCFSPVSIYPDDSLSVAHGRSYARPQSEVPPSEMPSPSGTHAALGDLMLQEFPSTATFNSLRSNDHFAGDSAGKKNGKGRVNDRPPRVPSPPPLPSLSQMALADADPDYRSPTYSIYGLYEAQRKSKGN